MDSSNELSDIAWLLEVVAGWKTKWEEKNNNFNNLLGDCTQQAETIEQLQAENAKLRSELEAIQSWIGGNSCGVCTETANAYR